MVVIHTLTLNPPVSVLYVALAITALPNAITFIGVRLGCGTYKTTSCGRDIVPFAVPGTPLASVYVTVTGILIVACTRAKLGLSSNLVIVSPLTVALDPTELPLTKLSGVVGLAGLESKNNYLAEFGSYMHQIL